MSATKNGVVCSVLFHSLTGADIGRIKTWEDKIRDHLLQCIKSGHFKKFKKPGSSDIIFCKIKNIKIQIFRYCRFPWDTIIPKTNTWIWHAAIRARNGIIANMNKYQTLFSMKNLIFIGIVLVA